MISTKDIKSIVSTINSLASRVRKLEVRPYSGIDTVTNETNILSVQSHLDATTIIYAGTTLLDSTYKVVLCNAWGGNITVQLPPSADYTGYSYTIKKIDPSLVYTVTIDPYSSETIDDATTKILNVQYLSVTIISNGARWYII